MRLTALFGLAFATASPHGLTSPHATNSQAHSSKGTPSPQQRRLRRVVSSRFQVLFHSPPGVLFTIPSRYYPLSVIREYLGLPRGRGSFTRDFTGPVLLGTPNQCRPGNFDYGTITHYGQPFKIVRLSHRFYHFTLTRQNETIRSHNPTHATTAVSQHACGLASSAFARHY